ncbi:MAG: hypothetical protein CME61_01580 [Halobacteriovoraceae bacterium]|nr:hypothetical protein [Halobacteriovoraceae bacterium]
MKRSLSIIFFLVILVNESLGCEVITPRQILINDIHSTERWTGVKTNCPSIKLQSLRAVFMRYEGEMPKLKLQNELKKIDVHLSSESAIIHIKNLSTQIKNLPTFKNKEIKIESLSDTIPNISGANIKLNLETLDSIKISTTGKDSHSHKSALTYKEKIECLVASANITPYNKQKKFKKVSKWLPSHKKASVFKSKTELNNYLLHYKFSSFIEKDKIITKSFFTKRNLLTFGKPAKVIFRDKDLTISTSGIPQSNGGINDTVMIKLSNNKIISGYIIDKDKVSASL